jgi:hypothetical protein
MIRGIVEKTSADANISLAAESVVALEDALEGVLFALVSRSASALVTFIRVLCTRRTQISRSICNFTLPQFQAAIDHASGDGRVEISVEDLEAVKKQVMKSKGVGK